MVVALFAFDAPVRGGPRRKNATTFGTKN